MSKPKLFVRTFGCQMNDYDSARMAEALADDCRPAEFRRRRRHSPFQHLLGARPRPGKSVFPTSAGRFSKSAKSPACSSESAAASPARRAKIFSAAPRLWIWFSGRKPFTACPRWYGGGCAKAAPRWMCRFRPWKNSTRCRRPGRRGGSAYVSVMEGCSKYCSFLCGALHPRRGNVAAAGRRAGRSRATGLAGRARNHPARPKCQRLPRARRRRRRH